MFEHAGSVENERGGEVTDTDKYNTCFTAASKAAQKLERAYHSGSGINKARLAYEAALKAMNDARNIMDERLNSEVAK